MIRVDRLRKSFGDTVVIDGISFSLPLGESISIIGPSGCGKTTLLYILAGMIPPSSGSVSIGNAGDATRNGISFVLQDYGLFPWKTVNENVSLGLLVKGVSAPERKKKTESLLEDLGLPSLGNRYPVQLSGGQKQRVAIARAIATDPSLLLLDEPFSSLDALTRESLQNTVLHLWKERSLTFAVVTHSVEEAVFLGKRILVLSDRPARIRKIVTNEGFGTSDFRMQDAYFQKIREIRALIDSNRSLPPEMAPAQNRSG